VRLARECSIGLHLGLIGHLAGVPAIKSDGGEEAAPIGRSSLGFEQRIPERQRVAHPAPRAELGHIGIVIEAPFRNQRGHGSLASVALTHRGVPDGEIDQRSAGAVTRSPGQRDKFRRVGAERIGGDMIILAIRLGRRQRDDRDRRAGGGIGEHRQQRLEVDRRLHQHLARTQLVERAQQRERTGGAVMPNGKEIARRRHGRHETLFCALSAVISSPHALLRRERSLTTWST
jgi:hypothetical protein